MLERLRQITQEVGQAKNTNQALQVVVTSLRAEFSCEVASIYLADYQTKRLTLAATDGLNPQSVGRLELDFNQGLVGLIAQREEPLNLEVAQEHPNFHFFREANEKPFQAFLGAPIVYQRRVLGVLVAQQKKARRFCPNEESFLVTLAMQLAGLIIQSTQREKLQPEKDSKHLVRRLDALPAASGIAIGDAVVYYPPADLSSVPDKPARSRVAETRKIIRAFARTREEIESLQSKMAALLGADELSLFDAYLSILSCDGLQQDVLDELEQGLWAPAALRRAIDRHTHAFEQLQDSYLRERINDLHDLGSRVLSHLEQDQTTRPKLTKKAILVAQDVTANMLAEVNINNIIGIISLKGSPNSHAAILAKALGIPAVCGVENVPVNLFQDQNLILDGYQGILLVAPDKTLLKQYQRLKLEEEQLSKDLEQNLNLPTVTLDGEKIRLMVNVGLLPDVQSPYITHSDGIGLYRTEIPFLMRQQFPSEADQQSIYQEIFKAYPNQYINVRTLDIGGDKQLPYFPINETNPFLGWRGIRITLDHPDIFLVQIKAILKASQGNQNLRISLPMIATVTEIKDSIRLIKQAYNEVTGETEYNNLPFPKLGIILEVPSVIYQLKSILNLVDFICVGTNDLSQYLLAIDRNNPRVSSLRSHLQPSLFEALKFIVKQCQKSKVELTLCGEMAADPLAAILLVGLGYDCLSLNGQSLPKVKKVVRAFSLREAQKLAREALKQDGSKAIYQMMADAFEQKNLGGLIRAGR